MSPVFSESAPVPFIVAVVGLPRCGSSMMMRMLHFGGMQVVADHATSYEADVAIASVVERTRATPSWVGKAVKLLDPQTYQPVRGYRYKFVWMRRDYMAQAHSQVKMMRMLAGLNVKYTGKLVKSLRNDTRRAFRLLASYEGSELIEICFEDVLENPEREARMVSAFLGIDLDVEAMAGQVIDRTQGCYDGLMEESLATSEICNREFVY